METFVTQFCCSPRCVPSCRLSLTMSWLLVVWISLGFLLLCQATLYQTIQQHHVARPGRTDILTLGMSIFSPILVSQHSDKILTSLFSSALTEMLQHVRVTCRGTVL